METFSEAICGGIGGFVGRSCAFPFDTLKVKRATRPQGGSLLQLANATFKEEGILGFYQGLQFSAFEAMYQKFLYVLLYTFMRQQHVRLSGGKSVGNLGNLTYGYLADLICTPFSMPLEAMVVELQSSSAKDSRAEIVRRNLFTWEGIKKNLKSGKAYFVLSLKIGIEFALFDKIKTMILKARKNTALGPDLSAGTAFFVGAFCRAVGTCTVYPYARGKFLTQSKMAPDAFSAIMQVLKSEGFLALYRGLSMELARGVTQAAVMFAVMERVRREVRKTLNLA